MDYTHTDADDFGLGLKDPADGDGVDRSFLEAKPGISPGPASGLPDGTDPETYRRTGPDGAPQQVTHPDHVRETPTNPPHNVTSPSASSRLPDPHRREHGEHHNLGDSDMETVEDLNTPKKDQPSDVWYGQNCSACIRSLAATLRGRANASG